MLLMGFSPDAKAQLVCSLDVSSVQFNAIDSLSAGTYDARGTLTVSCTGSNGAAIAACADLGQGPAGKSAASQRLLTVTGKGYTLPIQIFQDASLTRPWGEAGLSDAPMLTRTGDGPMSATIYIRLYVQKGAAKPGTYNAQFPVTLRYGAVMGYSANCGSLGSTIAAAPSKKATAAPIIGRRR